MKRVSALLLLAAAAVVALVGYRLSRHESASAAKRPACLAGHAPTSADFPAGLPVANRLVVRRRYLLHGARVTESYAPGTLREVRDFCRSQGLAQWKCPREIFVVPDLPRSPTGKVLKRVLAEKVAAQP